VFLHGGRQSGHQSRRFGVWQNPSTTDLLASIGKSSIEKRARISPFLDFLGDEGSKQSISDEEVAALQNWVIQTITKQMHSVKNPSITRRRDTALIAAICAAPAKGTPRKWPKNCLRITENEVLLWEAAIEAGSTRPTAALQKISPMEPVTAPFSRAQRRPLEPSSPAQRFTATRLRRTPPTASGPSLRRRSEPLSSGGILSQ